MGLGEGFWNAESKKRQKGQILWVQSGTRHKGPLTQLQETTAQTTERSTATRPQACSFRIAYHKH